MLGPPGPAAGGRRPGKGGMQGGRGAGAQGARGKPAAGWSCSWVPLRLREMLSSSSLRSLSPPQVTPSRCRWLPGGGGRGGLTDDDDLGAQGRDGGLVHLRPRRARRAGHRHHLGVRFTLKGSSSGHLALWGESGRRSQSRPGSARRRWSSGCGPTRPRRRSWREFLATPIADDTGVSFRG